MAGNNISETTGNQVSIAFCTQCGTRLAPGVRFCTSCGTPLPSPSGTPLPSSLNGDTAPANPASTPEFIFANHTFQIIADQNAAAANSAKPAADNASSEDNENIQIDFEQTNEYFNPPNAIIQTVKSILNMIIWILVVSIFIDWSFLRNSLIALILLGYFIHFALAKFVDHDEDYDAHAGAYLNYLPQQALEALNLKAEDVQEMPPIMIADYGFRGASLFKLGKNRCWRTNSVEASIIYFSADSLHIYTHNFLTTQPDKAESTSAYLYKDILSINIISEQVLPLIFANTNNPRQQRTYKQTYCELVTTGGFSFKIALPDNSPQAKASVKSMREFIQQKKSQA